MLIIQPSTVTDIPAFADIERSAGRLFLATDRPWVAAQSSTSTEEHRAVIDTGFHWVALVSRVPVGFLMAEIAADVLHIDELAVAQAYQGRGIGRSLVEHAAGEARSNGLAGVTLTTYRDLPWNGPFYRSLGFRELDEPLPAHLRERLDEEAASGHDPALRTAMMLSFR